MKLKLIAAAAVLAASGVANAAIDNGAGGNGELFFSAWYVNPVTDEGIGTSYTRDLNIRIDEFEALIAAPGALNLTFAADALFLNWLSTADVANLYWAITANDAQGARRIIETYTVGGALIPKGADVVRSLTGSIAQHVSDLNTALASANSAVYQKGVAGYADVIRYGRNSNDFQAFDRRATEANNSYANGIGMLRVNANASGIATATYTPYVDDGFAVRAYLDTTMGSATYGQLTIAAVPEPESYAMLLAGLGMMGAIARRRSRG